MTVYLDPEGHLRADTREELHAFARRIGLKREWYQDRPRLWHYDLTTPRKRKAALLAGAQPVTGREIVKVGVADK